MESATIQIFVLDFVLSLLELSSFVIFEFDDSCSEIFLIQLFLIFKISECKKYIHYALVYGFLPRKPREYCPILNRSFPLTKIKINIRVLHVCKNYLLISRIEILGEFWVSVVIFLPSHLTWCVAFVCHLISFSSSWFYEKTKI